ncbi:hypothetical protein FQA39_LY12962 [Lamprigera yunnana]|nr:hypothetical protein FQA39_LY12962 [Lamprigera yunnana]
MTDPVNISKALKQISEQVTDMYEEELLNLSLLRYMDKAKYGLENIGHFGLSSPCYTHFTSPIRRYSDLMVHRYLKQYIVNNNYNEHQLEDNENFIVKASHIINETEVTSVDCEREVNKACMAEYMQDKIGEVHEGIIVAALKFGIFVQLHNMVEGLVHISNLEEETIEAGIVLTGPEVKSIRDKEVNIEEAFILIRKGEAFILNMNIHKYEFATNIASLDPTRQRKLLLHKKEIKKLLKRIKLERLTLVPIKLYFRGNHVKLEIGLGKVALAYTKDAGVAAITAVVGFLVMNGMQAALIHANLDPITGTPIKGSDGVAS